MSEPTATAEPQYDPLMVVAVHGFTVAIWQVETDPTVTRGDFSGAWLVTESGIHGFAAEADWIDDRADQAAMLVHLLRYPYLPAEGTTHEEIETLKGQGGVGKKTTATELERKAHEAVEHARAEFARLAPGKPQPAWGKIGKIEPVEGSAPQEHDEAATEAIEAAMNTARGLRVWLREKQAFEKVRARRLDPLYDVE